MTAQVQKLTIGRILLWLLMIIILFVTLFPFWWVLRTALTTQGQIFNNTSSLLPVGFTWDNFARVLGLISNKDALEAGGSGQSINFFGFLLNSFVFSTTITVAQVSFSTMAAYAFARLRFPGRDFIFLLYVSALMVPGIVTLIPNFVLVRNLLQFFEIGDTYAGQMGAMVAPYFFMTPFAVFFLRQFFLGINRELEEAARIDGAGYFRTFWSVVLPLSRPPIVTLGIITFINAWNDYLWPFIVGRDESVRVLTVALNIFRSQQPDGAPDWTGLMAGTALAIIPVLIIYMFVGRQVIDSIQFTGFK
ncbi:MAG: carbohydrate ABC transporter permease [Chloroflexota bacterium]